MHDYQSILWSFNLIKASFSVIMNMHHYARISSNLMLSVRFVYIVEKDDFVSSIQYLLDDKWNTWVILIVRIKGFSKTALFRLHDGIKYAVFCVTLLRAS